MFEGLIYDETSPSGLRWTIDHNSVRANDRAGTFVGRYWRVRCKGVAYQAHRVIWEMFNGPIKRGFVIDHIDRNTKNNKIENLRIATQADNAKNSSLKSTNKSGVKGVCWSPSHRKWAVQMAVNGKQMHFGYFDDFAVAKELIRELRNKHHKEFSCH